MTLSEILERKGAHVYQTTPSATLANVVDDLVAHNVGSLLVFDDGQMVGIITERDILRACASRQGSLDQLLVQDHMTCAVVTASPQDRVGFVMSLLTEKRIRHLPVVENDRVVGLISIGDVVKAQSDELSVENHYLKSYIQGD